MSDSDPKPAPLAVWLVDDNELQRKALRSLLEGAARATPCIYGGPVKWPDFDDANVAIAQLRQTDVEMMPAVIFADVMMLGATEGAHAIYEELKKKDYDERRPFLLWTSGQDSKTEAVVSRMRTEQAELRYVDRWSDYWVKPNMVGHLGNEPRLADEPWVMLAAEVIQRQRNRVYRAAWLGTEFARWSLPGPWAQFQGELSTAASAPLVVMRGPHGSPWLACAEYLHQASRRTGQLEHFSPDGYIYPAQFAAGVLGSGGKPGCVQRTRDHGTLLLFNLGRNSSLLTEAMPGLHQLVSFRTFPSLLDNAPLSYAGSLVLAIEDGAREAAAPGSVICKFYEALDAKLPPTIRVPGLGEFSGQVAGLAQQMLAAKTQPKKSFDKAALALLNSHDWLGGFEDLLKVVANCAARQHLIRVGAEEVRKWLSGEAIRADVRDPAHNTAFTTSSSQPTTDFDKTNLRVVADGVLVTEKDLAKFLIIFQLVETKLESLGTVADAQAAANQCAVTLKIVEKNSDGKIPETIATQERYRSALSELRGANSPLSRYLPLGSRTQGRLKNTWKYPEKAS